MSSNDNYSSVGVTGPFPTYKTRATYPTGVAAATIYFDGIELFCFDGNQECTVAVNNRMPDHKLDFGIAKKGENGRQVSGLPVGARDIRVVVENPVEEGVYVYAPNPANSTPDKLRYSFVQYTMDVEGPRFHDIALPKITDALSPRFHIKNGLFFGYKLSDTRFEVRRRGVHRELGNVALAVGADIFVKTSANGSAGSIKFFADDQNIPFFDTGVIEAGDRYEIKITNTTGRCEQHVNYVDTSEPTDFRYNYEAIDISESERFLIYDETDKVTYPEKTLGEFIRTLRGNAHQLCDGHPCQGMVCGRTKQIREAGE